jgi:DNA primase
LEDAVARIADEEVERLKKEVSLEALVAASGVELKKAGADLVGRCPFHDDREPSLVVSPGKNLWHCLGPATLAAAPSTGSCAPKASASATLSSC